MELVYLALSQIIISIVLSIVIMFISYKMLLKLFRLKDQKINNDNLAISIFFSGIIFSIGYLLSGIIPSIINAIELIRIHKQDSMYFEIFKYSSIALLIGFLMSCIILFTSFTLLKSMTKYIKEMSELKQNNMAVALLLSSILISITLICKDSLIFLLDIYVPQPEVVKFN